MYCPLQWMKEQGIASVRLPISYYHFIPGHPDPNVQAMMKGTEYEFFAPIYQSAFNCIRRTIEKAAQYEIGVLIDLHAAPGGQNSDGHSGLSGGKANFYNSVNMKKTTLILRAIVDTFGQMENVTGLELINEPQDNCKLADWYKEVIKQVHQNTASPNIPLILGDCWNTSKYTSLIVSNNEVAAPVILDHHLYRCFTPGDCHKSAAHHAADIEPGKNGPTDNFLRDSSFKLGKNLIIGEWSAALNPGSFQGQEGHKKELQQAWARAQLSAFNQHCAGHFFWTLKKEGNTDVGWCLYSAIERDILPLGLGRPRQGMDIDKLEERGRQELENNYKGHVDYWNQHAKGKQMHHEFYRDGFAQIYKDCVEFYRWCGDEIGFTSQWVKVRTNSHSQEKGGQGDWEFRDGGNKAIECFLRALWS